MMIGVVPIWLWDAYLCVSHNGRRLIGWLFSSWSACWELSRDGGHLRFVAYEGQRQAEQWTLWFHQFQRQPRPHSWLRFSRFRSCRIWNRRPGQVDIQTQHGWHEDHLIRVDHKLRFLCLLSQPHQSHAFPPCCVFLMQPDHSQSGKQLHCSEKRIKA